MTDKHDLDGLAGKRVMINWADDEIEGVDALVLAVSGEWFRFIPEDGGSVAERPTWVRIADVACFRELPGAVIVKPIREALEK